MPSQWFRRSGSRVGVVVQLYGCDVREGKLVPREPFYSTEAITVEEVITAIADRLHINALALPLFGLKNAKGWLPPSTILSGDQELWFCCMMALPDKDRLHSFIKYCLPAVTYFADQVRYQLSHKELPMFQQPTPSKYVKLMTNSLMAFGYNLGLTLDDLKNCVGRSDIFSTKFYDSLSSKSAWKAECKEKLEKYEHSCNGQTRKEYLRHNLQHFVDLIMEHCVGYGEQEYETTSDAKLSVVSLPAAGASQGLRIISSNKNYCIKAEDICKVAVDRQKLTVTCLDSLQTKEFMLKNSEDANSLAVLLNTLCKLSINYINDVCPDVQSSFDKALQEHHCFPPARKQWIQNRLDAVTRMNQHVKYIVCRDTDNLQSVKVFLQPDRSSGQGLQVLDVVRTSLSDEWVLQNDSREILGSFPLGELGNKIAQLFEDTTMQPVPLCLPFDTIIYHCQPVEETHSPTVLDQCITEDFLSKGSFTSVHKASARFPSQNGRRHVTKLVAVKKLDADEHYRAFTDMTNAMIHWKHKNLICLAGISLCSGVEAILDFCENDHLLNFFTSDDAGMLKKKHLLQISEQLVEAVVYLENLRTHKDLGDLGSHHGNIKAKNVLVMDISEETVWVKLGDTGLISAYRTMPMEHYANMERLSWMAPEVLRDREKMTCFSDVYAIGVFLWEVWTVGQLPYTEILSNPQINERTKVEMIQQYVHEGGRLMKPGLASEGMYALMQDCWNPTPMARPSPLLILQQLHHFITAESHEGPVTDCRIESTIDKDKVRWNLANAPGARVAEMLDNSQNERQARQMQAGATNLQSNGIQTNITSRARHISSSDIKILEKILGQGAFGKVYKGWLYFSDDRTKEVAIKECKKLKEMNSFHAEIALMSQLDYEYIVKIEGFYMHDFKRYLVMEFMNCGSLKSFVSSNGPHDSKSLLKLAENVAKGMNYLVSKKVIHRDLAARNVLVASQDTGGHIAKVCDFGLSRILKEDIYKMSSRNSLPWKWYAPEALGKHSFSHQSDVWSFGCVVWEMFDGCRNTLALDPEGAKHLDMLRNNDRREKPEDCPEDVYSKVIMKCWAGHPENRPSFDALVEILTTMLS